MSGRRTSEAQAARRARLERALRENLKRRKAQARRRGEPADPAANEDETAEQREADDDQPS